MIKVNSREFKLIKHGFKNYALDLFTPARKQLIIIAEHDHLCYLTGSYIVAKVTLVTMIAAEMELKGVSIPMTQLNTINFRVFCSNECFGSLTDACKQVVKMNNIYNA